MKSPTLALGSSAVTGAAASDSLPGQMNIEYRQLNFELEVVAAGEALVRGATTPRARTCAAYALINALEAFGCKELGAPVAASLAVLEGQDRPDTVLIGALQISGNAVLHRALKLDLISYKAVDGARDEFTFQAPGIPFVCGWLVFKAVSALVSDSSERGAELATGLLRDGLGLLEPLPDAAAKMVTFFRSIDIERIASEGPLESVGDG